jgi:hypothetical protein
MRYLGSCPHDDPQTFIESFSLFLLSSPYTPTTMRR